MRSARPHILSVNETIVLAAILGLVMAILIPVAEEGRDRARAAACASNLSRLMSAMYAYADDHDGRFAAPLGNFAPDLPAAWQTWHAALVPYLDWDADAVTAINSGITWRSDSRQINTFTCPTSIGDIHRLPGATSTHLNPWFMYGLNADLPAAAYFAGRRSGINISTDDLLHPAETMAILETLDWSAMYSREINPDGSGLALIPHGNAANVAFYDGSVRRIPLDSLVSHPETSHFWQGGYSD